MLDGQLDKGGAVAIARAHHGLDLLLIATLLEGSLELILGGNIGCIVLVHLLRSVSFAQLHALPGVRTRLYEFSKKVAMMARDWCRRFPVSPEVSSYNGVVLVAAVNAHSPWVSRISGMLRVLIECGGRERCAG